MVQTNTESLQLPIVMRSGFNIRSSQFWLFLICIFASLKSTHDFNWSEKFSNLSLQIAEYPLQVLLVFTVSISLLYFISIRFWLNYFALEILVGKDQIHYRDFFNKKILLAYSDIEKVEYIDSSFRLANTSTLKLIPSDHNRKKLEINCLMLSGANTKILLDLFGCKNRFSQ